MYKNKNIFLATKNAMNGLRALLKARSAQRELVLLLVAITLFC